MDGRKGGWKEGKKEGDPFYVSPFKARAVQRVGKSRDGEGGQQSRIKRRDARCWLHNISPHFM